MKSFDGLDPTVIRTYHKSHISKMICICTVGYVFEDCVENGGMVAKIGLSRCQSHKLLEGYSVRCRGMIMGNWSMIEIYCVGREIYISSNATSLDHHTV